MSASPWQFAEVSKNAYASHAINIMKELELHDFVPHAEKAYHQMLSKLPILPEFGQEMQKMQSTGAGFASLLTNMIRATQNTGRS